jgi:hypothetical protein
MPSTRTRITSIPVLAAGIFAASLPISLKALAQDASPEAGTVENPFADLGLPEIELHFTSTEIAGMPESIEAGRYLVTIHGEPTPEDWAFSPMFVQAPEGMTAEEMMAEAEAATEGPPEFFYSAVIAGGPAIMAGSGATSAYGVVDLPAGDWVLVGASPAQSETLFTVTGELPADLAEPEADVTLTIGEMVINVTDGAFSVGENVVKVENIGAQPHFVELSKVPDGTTDENIEATIATFMGGTPEAEPLGEEDFHPVGYTSDQSGGTVQWAVMTIAEPGTYAATCWIPDPETMMPHAAMGMHTVIEIEG